MGDQNLPSTIAFVLAYATVCNTYKQIKMFPSSVYVSFTVLRGIQIAGAKRLTFTDLVASLMTCQHWQPVKQLVSTTEAVLLSTGSRATVGNPVGF